MSTQSLVIFLAIGILAGFVAGKLMKGSGFGLLGDLLVGIVGALLLLYLVRLLKRA